MSQPPDPASALRVVALHDREGVLQRVRTQPELVQPRFVPIADLKRGIVAGYEVLLTLGGEEALDPPGWSSRAHVTSAGTIETALLRVALARRDALLPNTFMLISLSAGALRSQELHAVLAGAGSLERVVVTVSDHDGHDGTELRRALETAREAGALVAVDDTGSGYASLRQLLAIRPDFVRIGADFVAEVDRDQAKAAVVETLGALASRIDAWLIAGGVPSRPELGALRRMGVPLVQGPMVGLAGETMEPLRELVTHAIRQASPPAEAAQTVAPLIEGRPALEWGGGLEDIADAFLDDPRNEVVVLVDERNRPLALAERAAMLRGEPFERPVMRVNPSSPLKAVARRAAARPMLERYHPLVACDRRGVYLGLVRVEALLDALAAD